METTIHLEPGATQPSIARPPFKALNWLQPDIILLSITMSVLSYYIGYTMTSPIAFAAFCLFSRNPRTLLVKTVNLALFLSAGMYAAHYFDAGKLKEVAVGLIAPMALYCLFLYLIHWKSWQFRFLVTFSHQIANKIRVPWLLYVPVFGYVIALTVRDHGSIYGGTAAVILIIFLLSGGHASVKIQWFGYTSALVYVLLIHLFTWHWISMWGQYSWINRIQALPTLLNPMCMVFMYYATRRSMSTRQAGPESMVTAMEQAAPAEQPLEA